MYANITVNWFAMRPRNFVCMLVLMHIACVGLQAQEPSPEKIAILIGVSKYEHASMNGNDPLKYPEEDAKAVGRLLAQHYYQVEYLLGPDATRTAIEQKLESLIHKGNANGVAFVGFFGHGVQVSLRDSASGKGSVVGCFCPYDTGIQYAVDASGKQLFVGDGKKQTEPNPASLIKMSEVAEALGNAKAQTRFMVADCCRDLPNRARGRNLGFGANFGTDKLPSQTVMLFGCKPGEQSLERDDWKHGAFTKALLDELNAMMELGPVTTGTLSDRVKSRVQVLTGNLQNPTPISLDSIDLMLGQRLSQHKSFVAIDDEIIDRWIEKGFDFGYYRRQKPGTYEFVATRENAGFAGFRFHNDPSDLPDLGVLPAPNVPFGVSFSWGEKWRISPENIGQLRRFKNLRLLDLGGNDFARDTLASIFELRSLEHLNLEQVGDPELFDMDFQGIEKLSHLKTLSLYHQDSITSQVASYLAELPELEVLDLSYTQLGDANGLALLARNGKLREIHCTRTNLNGKSGKALGSIKSLRTLTTVANKGISEEFVRDLSGLIELENLDMSFCKLSDICLLELQSLKKLRTLNIGSNKVTDKGIASLAKCSSLVDLNIGWLSSVTGACLSELAKLKDLRVLRCTDNNFDEREMHRLTELRQLNELDLSFREIGPFSLETSLRGLDDLRSLDLQRCSLEDDQLVKLPVLKRIESLNVGGNPKLTNKIVDRLRDCRGLRELDLYGIPLTDECIPKLKTMRSLRKLNVVDSKISDAGIKQLRESLPDCKIIDK